MSLVGGGCRSSVGRRTVGIESPTWKCDGAPRADLRWPCAPRRNHRCRPFVEVAPLPLDEESDRLSGIGRNEHLFQRGPLRLHRLAHGDEQTRVARKIRRLVGIGLEVEELILPRAEVNELEPWSLAVDE